MGCTQSKIENEEAVARCKERKHHMKEAVSARNAFAAAHSSYATYLKNTGAALSDFAHGEVENPQLASTGLPNVVPQTQAFEIPPPPPPLPPMSNLSPSPLQRAASMPEIKMIKPESTPVGPIIEEEENELENEESLSGGLRRRRSRNAGSSRIGTKKEVDEEEAARPPMPPPQSKPAETQLDRETHDHPVPQLSESAAWEYFFPSMENIAGTTLGVQAEPVSSSLARDEEFERKASDEKPNRVVDDDDRDVMRSGKDEVPEPTPMPEKVVEPQVQPPAAMAAAAVGMGPKKVKQGSIPMEAKRIVKQSVNMLQIFTELDDHFLKASESAHEVSKMLEATRLHYHSNFADNRGNGFDSFDSI